MTHPQVVRANARRVSHVTLACALHLVAVGCQDTAKTASVATAQATKLAPVDRPTATVSAPATTQLAITADGVLVNGKAVAFVGDGFVMRLQAELSGKPNVEGQGVPLSAPRSAKFMRINEVGAALVAVNANALALTIPARDGKLQTLRFALGGGATKVPACAAVGYIGKDMAITTWSLGGGAGKRFSKGMAGPDLTLGAESLHKAAVACPDAGVYVSAEESITAGLVVDLALAAREPVDIPLLNVDKLGMLREPVLPGRKVLPL
jgi:hypothetical protein